MNTVLPELTNAGQDAKGMETSGPKANAALSEARWATRTVPGSQQPSGRKRSFPFQDKDHPELETQLSADADAITAMNSAIGAPKNGVGSG